eukprot:GCRY01005311.1.p1 GENE.GCRY01005311.1~~GCRY01005311.1.p1  ORF type:complete len:602 (-),score=165.87 GCRY01005311.1:30-1835(-)
MSMEDVTNEIFDAIICGTGLTESMLAAALSIEGHKVLHLDGMSYYGNCWSSLSLKEWGSFAKDSEKKSSNGEFSGNQFCSPFFDMKTNSYFTEEEFSQLFRRFSLDILFKFVLSNSLTVEKMVSSNIGQYIEFFPLESLFLFHENAFSEVPCGRESVFKSTLFSPIEKRILMKFLKAVAAHFDEQDGAPPSEFKDDLQTSFISVLKSRRMSEVLQCLVLYVIAQCSFDQAIAENQMTCEEGLRRVQEFISSAGVYGATPYILPLYGLGGLGQAYCRQAAVHGATYILNRGLTQCVGRKTAEEGEKEGGGEEKEGGEEGSAEAVPSGKENIKKEEDKKVEDKKEEEKKEEKTGKSAQPVFVVKDTEGESLKARAIISSEGFVSSRHTSPEPTDILYRAVLVCEKPLLSQDLALLTVPPSRPPTSPDCFTGLASTLHVLQLSSKMMQSPAPYYVFHLSATAPSPTTAATADEFFAPFVSAYFFVAEDSAENSSSEKPCVKWSSYFSQHTPCSSSSSPTATTVNGCPLYIVTHPDGSYNPDTAVVESHRIFSALLPTAEFLPEQMDNEELMEIETMKAELKEKEEKEEKAENRPTGEEKESTQQ